MPAPATRRELPTNWRREVKLLVNPEIRAALLDWLGDLLPPDPVAPGGYQVRSLYYDTDDMSVYRHKKDGNLRRFKLRLRTYPSGGDADRGVLEIKWRIGDLAWKERRDGTLAELDALTRDPFAPEQLPSLPLLLANYRFRPRIVVDYRRLAFVEHGPDPVRVTMDGPVYAWRAEGLDALARGDAASDPISRGYSVLEIKFQQSLPFWQAAMAERWHLPQVPFSKYVEAIHKLLVDTPYDFQLMPFKPVNDDVLAGLFWA